FRSRGVEAGGAHGDDLDLVRALHGGDGVAGVDGALEGVGTDHLGDVADLPDVQLGGHARGDVLAAGGGREQDVAVVACNGNHLGGDVLGQAVVQRRAVGEDDLGDAGDLGGGFGRGRGVGASHEHMHAAATLGGRGDGVERGALEAVVVVFGNDEDGHGQITLASFLSLFTRVATSGTLMPALRLGGSLTFSVLMRGATSTPRSSGLTVSSGFFLAFMMLGRVT